MHSSAAQKKAFVGIMGALSSLAAYGTFWQLKRYQESTSRWNKVLGELETYTPHNLKGFDAKYYPWIREGSLANWEYRLVKLTGYFKEERFFVSRSRDGRAGYCVFAPFVTAMEDADLRKENNANTMQEFGCMVNLGWVPKENKDDIEMGGEPTPVIEPVEGADLLTEDPETLFVNNPDNLVEEHVVSLTEVVGIVKRGEKQDVSKGMVNFPYDGVYQFVDLPFMARMFKFSNYDGASQAYVERMIANYDEEEEGLYPVPATKETFFKPYLVPRKHLEYASFWGGATLIGLSSILFYGLK